MPRPFDGCFIVDDDRTILVEEWLTKHQLLPECCGLSTLQHVFDGYALFYADDSDAFVSAINGSRATTPVILSKSNRKTPSELGNDLYNERNLTERCSKN
jgi:hypothetical protein